VAALAEPRILSTPATAHVRSSRGDELPIRIWTPPSGVARRVVVALHGLVTHSGWFNPIGELLAARGIATVATDRRGSGLARGLGHLDDPAQLVADVDAVVTSARALSDDVTLFSWCGSANFAVQAAAQVPIDRFVMAAPGLIGHAELGARFRAIQPVDGLLPTHFDPGRDFTADPAVAAAIDADPLWLRGIPVAVRSTWGQLNPVAREALGGLRVETRCVLTRTDRIVDVPRTLELLGAIPIEWATGGHGFVVEPDGARFMAAVLER
jgi:alpha-beta hydrolase superfamily lysophospholipase